MKNPARTPSTPDGERELNGHVYLHQLGTVPEADVPLFGPSLQPGLRPDDTPDPAVSADGRWLVIAVRRAAGRALWAAPLEGPRLAGQFREVLTTDGAFSGWGVRDDTLWAITPDGGPRHRLVRVALRDPVAVPEAVLEGSDGVLSGLAVAADATYVAQRDGAMMSLWRLTPAGGRDRVALPRAGTLSRLTVKPEGRGVRVWLRSALHPEEWLGVEAGAREARPLRPSPAGLPPALDRYAVTVVHAPARDGVLIPVTLLHARSVVPDGTGFVRMEAYGCYGSALTPYYDPGHLAWLERGGTVAYAHVRGGTELGRAWHETAVARGRATAYEDVVDVVKNLVREGWAAPRRVALVGSSCGAATVGVAALERPDLIAAASLHVGGVDEWRGWSETASGARSVLDLRGLARGAIVRAELARLRVPQPRGPYRRRLAYAWP